MKKIKPRRKSFEEKCLFYSAAKNPFFLKNRKYRDRILKAKQVFLNQYSYFIPIQETSPVFFLYDFNRTRSRCDKKEMTGNEKTRFKPACPL